MEKNSSTKMRQQRYTNAISDTGTLDFLTACVEAVTFNANKFITNYIFLKELMEF